MDVGIFSRIEEDIYEVYRVHAPGLDLAKGATFTLGDTYCDTLLQADKVLSIDHPRNDRRHPCYPVFDFESYIGAQVFVEEQLFGTVNFSAFSARRQPFTDKDEELLNAFANWLGLSLEKQRAQTARRDAERRFRRLAEVAFEAIALSENGIIQDVNPAFCDLFGYARDEAIDRSADYFCGSQRGGQRHEHDLAWRRTSIRGHLSAPRRKYLRRRSAWQDDP